LKQGTGRASSSSLNILVDRFFDNFVVTVILKVLPRDAFVAVVGGIFPDSMKTYRDAGANCFGLGSALFKPSYTIEEIGERAQSFMKQIK
jgi:2-dehydro-3-deoxyphosphogalactonate aldolase